jgi:hypothetical protein
MPDETKDPAGELENEQPAVTDTDELTDSLDEPAGDVDDSWMADTEEDGDEAEFDRRVAEIRAERKGQEPPKEEPAPEAGQEPPKEEPAPPAKSDWTTTVGSAIGLAFDSDDQAIEHIRTLKDENEGYDALRQIIQGNEKLGAFFQAMLQDELDAEDAAARAFGFEKNAPDPYDDPDAYADFMKKRGREEAEREQQRRELDTQNARIDRAHKDIDRAFDAFTAQYGLKEGEAKAFIERFALYRHGDPDTGRIPPDVFERERKADHYDADVKKARDEGIAAGRNEAIKELTSRRGKRGDTVPALAGSRAPATDISAEARRSQTRRRIFAEDGTFDADWPPKR